MNKNLVRSGMETAANLIAYYSLVESYLNLAGTLVEKEEAAGSIMMEVDSIKLELKRAEEIGESHSRYCVELVRDYSSLLLEAADTFDDITAIHEEAKQIEAEMKEIHEELENSQEGIKVVNAASACVNNAN